MSTCPPEDDASSCAAQIAAAYDEVDAVCVLSMDDSAVWLCARAFANRPDVVAGPMGALAEFALDKRIQLEAARAAGFAVPQTRVFATGKELAAVEGPFPCMVKAALAVQESSGRLLKLPSTVAESTDALREFAVKAGAVGPFLFQPLLRGEGQGVFGLGASAGVSCRSAHRRVRMLNPMGSGSSACETVEPPRELVEQSTRMMEALGWRGLFMVELLCDRDGVKWFMEANGRAWGSMDLARRAGLENPAWTVRTHLSQGAPEQLLEPVGCGCVMA